MVVPLVFAETGKHVARQIGVVFPSGRQSKEENRTLKDVHYQVCRRRRRRRLCSHSPRQLADSALKTAPPFAQAGDFFDVAVFTPPGGGVVVSGGGPPVPPA